MKILIADDDSFSRKIAETAIRKLGYEVVSVSDGKEALRVLEEEDSPRLAVLDWMMPGMEGVEVVRKIREGTKDSPYVYIILLTGRGERDDLVQGLEAGADDYIVKPFEVNELRARIRCGERIVELHSELVAARVGQEIINKSLRTEIGERERVEKSIEEAKQEWELTFDTVPDLIAILDTRQRIVRVNKSMANKFGAHPRDIIGKPCYKLCHEAEVPPLHCPFGSTYRNRTEQVAEIFEEKWGGYFMVSVTPLYDKCGRMTGCVHVARDVTEKKRMEEELVQLACHDPLTRLPNRRYFLESLSVMHENAKRYGNQLSLCVFDIDYFKEVNDKYGHHAGDQVLMQFAEIMRSELRGSDVPGRYGGDEFIAAFPNTPVTGATESVERIRSLLQQTLFQESRRSYRVSCTAGVAEFVPVDMTIDELISAADIALYEAKKQGRNRVVVSGGVYPYVRKALLHS